MRFRSDYILFAMPSSQDGLKLQLKIKYIKNGIIHRLNFKSFSYYRAYCTFAAIYVCLGPYFFKCMLPRIREITIN